MSKGKLTSRPPVAGLGSVEEFITGAAIRTTTATDLGMDEKGRERQVGQGRYPWQQPTVREDVTKIFNLRLPEAYLLKLKYIAERTPDSMQQFCLAALFPAIDDKIEELTRKE